MQIVVSSMPFFLMLCLVPLVITLSNKLNLLDAPNERKIHIESISRLGGIAIFASILIAFFIAAAFHLINLQTPLAKQVVAGGLIAFLFGVVDDVRNISYKIKLVFQLLLSFTVYYLGFRINSIQVGLDTSIHLGIFSLPVTVLWIATVMNALNMIDGLDGLAGGVSFIVFATLSVLGYFNSNPFLMMFSMMAATACLGFLVFNFNPAKIFMGDSGSMMLGCLLAILSVSSSESPSENTINFFMPLFLLAFPLIDLTIAILRRMIYAKTTEKGISPIKLLRRTFDADGNHIHHRLLKLGLSQRKIAVIMYGFTVISCVLALICLYVSLGLVFFLFIFYVWFTVQCVRLLDYEEFVTKSFRNQMREFEEKKKLSTAPSLIRRVNQESQNV